MIRSIAAGIAAALLAGAAFAQDGVPAPTLFLCDGGLVVRAEFGHVDPDAATMGRAEANALTVAHGGAAPVDCAPVPGGAALVGAPWRLVQFQSSSDEIGTLVPDDPGMVTIDFRADGRVGLRLDCNRGNGTWQAEPARPEGGGLTFGPIATTRAACPPGGLGDRFAADLPYVRGYLMRDGTLNLALFADGGIWTFDR
jgi:heat shock protein HslJ